MARNLIVYDEKISATAFQVIKDLTRKAHAFLTNFTFQHLNIEKLERSPAFILAYFGLMGFHLFLYIRFEHYNFAQYFGTLVNLIVLVGVLKKLKKA